MTKGAVRRAKVKTQIETKRLSEKHAIDRSERRHEQELCLWLKAEKTAYILARVEREEKTSWVDREVLILEMA